MDDDAAAGAAHGLEDRVEVERGDRAQVDDLERAALLGGRLGRLQRRLHHRAVGQHGDVVAAADHPGARTAAPGVASVSTSRLLPVPPLGLEEDDRVGVGDRLLDAPVGVDRVADGDDLEPGGVREVGLGALAVVLDRADAAAERDADDDRHRQPAPGAGVDLGDLGDDLVVGGEDEPVELDLADRPVAAHGQADGGAEDAGLGQRGVDDAVLAEVLLQAVGDPEDPAELADVLAHEHDLGVVLHGLAQAEVERLADGQRLRSPHQCSPPSKVAW